MARFDDETVEPEVIIRLPRGSDPAPELTGAESYTNGPGSCKCGSGHA